MFGQIQQASFRSLRRTLPVNKKLFDWKNPQIYRVAGRFQSRA